MPREQKTKAPPETAKALDAFENAQGARPSGLDRSIADLVATNQPGDTKAAPQKPKDKPKPAKDKPVVHRMGRRRTGRNVQFNQTVTAETANKYYHAQAELDIPMGAVLERAINALLEKMGTEGESR